MTLPCMKSHITRSILWRAYSESIYDRRSRRGNCPSDRKLIYFAWSKEPTLLPTPLPPISFSSFRPVNLHIVIESCTRVNLRQQQSILLPLNPIIQMDFFISSAQNRSPPTTV